MYRVVQEVPNIHISIINLTQYGNLKIRRRRWWFNPGSKFGCRHLNGCKFGNRLSDPFLSILYADIVLLLLNTRIYGPRERGSGIAFGF